MEENLEFLIKKDDIINCIITLFNKTDEKDWDQVKDCFTEKVFFDMSSLGGGEPTYLSSQEIIDTWDEGLRDIEKIHHQAGNFIVTLEGNEADVYCYAIAIHYKQLQEKNNTRTFIGSYDFHLVNIKNGWKIDKFKFNLKFLDGNIDLM